MTRLKHVSEFDTIRLERLEVRSFLDAAGQVLEPFIHTGRLVHEIETADFDGDGDQDIAILLSEGREANPWRSLLVLLSNDGSGVFTKIAQRRMRQSAGTMAAGDFDGNGVAEIATAVPRVTANGSVIRVFSADSNTGVWRVVASRGRPGDILQIEAVAAGESEDSLLVLVSTPQEEVASADVMRIDGTTMVTVHSLFSLSNGLVDRVRIVDPDGDGRDDVLVPVASESPTSDLLDVSVQLYRQDSASPGIFDARDSLLSYQSISRFGVPLLAEVTGDEHADLIIASRPGDRAEVLLHAGEADGSFAEPVLLRELDLQYPLFGGHAIVGSGVGPQGEFEIWVTESYAVGGGSSSGGSVSLIRLLRQGDGSFQPRGASLQMAQSPRAMTGEIQFAQLTADTATDFIAVSRRAGLHAPREGSISVLTFDGTNRRPLVSFRILSIAGSRTARSAADGDQIALYVQAADPESMIGEHGGTRHVRLFLDTNGNGRIDPADYRILSAASGGYPGVAVSAAWPRGTFNVLARARDIENNWSETVCGEFMITIV